MTDRDLGLIGRAAKEFFSLLKKLPPQCLIEDRIQHQVRISKLSNHERETEINKRMLRTEGIIIGYFLFYVIIVLCKSLLIKYCAITWAVIVLLLLRLIDIIQVNVNIAIFDTLEIRKHIPKNSKKSAPDFILSFTRSIILASYNFIEIAIIFGMFYFLLPSCFSSIGYLNKVGKLCFADNIYFSFITQLTVGYGDITPRGFLKILSIVQGTIAYFFSILIISRFLALFPKISSNEEINDGRASEHGSTHQTN